MNLIFISKSEELKKALDFHFIPLGFSITHCSDPIEVINNIDSLIFDAILFDAGDFPRHWKPLIKLLREYKSKEKAVVILANKEGFPFEEASKAIFLEINGLISENLSNKELISRLEEILRRYKDLPDNRKFSRMLLTEEDNFTFIFTHPQKMALIFGDILDISIQGMNFAPYDQELTKDLLPGMGIPECTLRINENIITLSCQVARNNSTLGIIFEGFEEGDHNKLFQYLMTKPERELQKQLHSSCHRED